MTNTGIGWKRIKSGALARGFIAGRRCVSPAGKFLPFYSALILCFLVAGCESTPHHHAPVVDSYMPEPGKPGPISETGALRSNVHIVKKGDTLYSIAQSHGINQKDLAEWNNIRDPGAVHIGQQLILSSPTPLAQPSLFPIQEPLRPSAAPAAPAAPAAADAGSQTGTKYPINTDKLKTGPKAFKLPYSEQAVAQMKKGLADIPPSVMTVKADPSPEKNISTPGIDPIPPTAEAAPDDDRVEWTWPTKGKVLDLFSESTKGIDIVGKTGQAVTASAGGKVVYSGAGLRGYGKLIIIKHNNTYLSAYAHNDKLLVKEGETVVKGQKIAEMGNTDSSLVKLHFEIRKNGKPVDPLKHLPGLSG
ncbi:peptidoglycan DD-metalloendopeptidase family protein [Nitrosovibrio sp. Nv4]|uniref:peptidoglycan DD-metalloendopeptidase family protein n=1 Tax=Nitrosovibrio sp. Nv4 TaxID=1945880 RepID=UPI000BD1AFBB|nr:peptidoglycan DD-metalloendopeptidase family protein [Nitrosovibrio sp. Nv4]SOD40695.1 lipoprotein NlpD [Nitrosovibrio sp. Nv4]